MILHSQIAFAIFFAEKVNRIAKALEESPSYVPYDSEIVRTDLVFDEFVPVPESQVVRIITNSRSATCGLDPLPTCLVKKCVLELSPIITRIINMSFQEGYFPNRLKHANISPLLKKVQLDSEDLKNYRPIANLAFLGKIVERAAISQIIEHLSCNNLYPSSQSAYRPHHSCETALVRVYKQ